MRRLMLLRHAKTESDAPSGRDRDRRLDHRGQKDAAELGGWIGRHPPFPDLVMVSPAVRAKQTWELVWQVMKDRAPPPQVEFLPRQALAENLPTAGLAVFEFKGCDWNDVAVRHGRLVGFVSPKLLKQISGD